jgi:hypothetical protein
MRLAREPPLLSPDPAWAVDGVAAAFVFIPYGY